MNDLVRRLRGKLIASSWFVLLVTSGCTHHGSDDLADAILSNPTVEAARAAAGATCGGVPTSVSSGSWNVLSRDAMASFGTTSCSPFASSTGTASGASCRLDVLVTSGEPVFLPTSSVATVGTFTGAVFTDGPATGGPSVGTLLVTQTSDTTGADGCPLDGLDVLYVGPSKDGDGASFCLITAFAGSACAADEDVWEVDTGVLSADWGSVEGQP